MQKFVEKIVSMMKSEGLFEWQGGPIIMAQVCTTVTFPVQTCKRNSKLEQNF